MDVDVSAAVLVERPRSEVASFASDPANDTKWIGGIKEVRVATPAPFGVGTRVERIAYFRKKRVDYVLEVVAYEPGALVDMKSVKAPFEMRVTYRFEDALGGTRASIHIGGGPKGPIRLIAPIVRRTVLKSIAKDLVNLKGILEAEGDSSPRRQSPILP